MTWRSIRDNPSQLFPVPTGRNAQFLATIQIDLNVSHTGKVYYETDRSGFLGTLPRDRGGRSNDERRRSWGETSFSLVLNSSLCRPHRNTTSCFTESRIVT